MPQTHKSEINLLLAARGLRGFGDGFAAIILPAYLSALGLSPAEFGVVATVSLLGSALLTLLIGRNGHRFEVRTLLLTGAALGIVSGLAYPLANSFAFILLIAFFGTVNPTGGDLNPALPLEHATLTANTSDSERTRIFSHYSLVGTFTGAAGSLAAGMPQFIAAGGVEPLTAFRVMFLFYAVLALCSALLYARIPKRHIPGAPWPPAAALGPSRGIVYKLAALFSLDSFASGFVVQSLFALWLFERFELSLAATATFFFCSNLLAAASFPVAVWLSKRIGLINTMVYTHIPANLILVAAAFIPDLTIVLTLLLIRAALSQMDVPTRSSYVMAVVTPAERPAAASLTAVPRSLAAAASPALGGLLMGATASGLPLVVAGLLKTVYDLALLAMFRHIKPPEETR